MFQNNGYLYAICVCRITNDARVPSRKTGKEINNKICLWLKKEEMNMRSTGVICGGKSWAMVLDAVLQIFFPLIKKLCRRCQSSN